MAQVERSEDRDPLCNVCVEFTTHAVDSGFRVKDDNGPKVSSPRWTGLPRGAFGFRHHSTFDELSASARAGCALCHLLADDFGSEGANGQGGLILHPFFESRPAKFLATFEEDKACWWYWGKWEPHVFNILRHRPYDARKEAVVDAEGKTVGEPDRFYRAIPRTTGDKDSLDTARHWLDCCVKNHRKCRRPDTYLPTRVIDVGEPPYQQNPSLYIPAAKEKSLYLALSHCWGGNIPCKLTEALFQQYQQTLPMNELPRNFVDAIRVTRELGLRYLWIDALCIIQDSQADWLAEAGKMASFYSQALMTISALDAEKSTEGFLGDRQRVQVKIDRDFSVSQDGLMMADIMDHSALDKRGWCMQERLLSPALLHFSKEQLAWECQEGIMCEQYGMVPNWPSDRANSIDSLTTSFISLRRNYIAGAIKPGFEAWYNLVEEFSSRSLTFDNDMLPALAGAALRFRTRSGGGQNDISSSTYLAGLWVEDIRQGLFWGARSSPQRNARSIKKSGFSRLSRPTQNRFPSWSWASVRGAVEFPLKTWDAEEMRPERWRDFEVVAMEIRRGYDDLMAMTVEGELRIRAPIARVCYEGYDDSTSGSVGFGRGADGHLEDYVVDMAAVMDSDQAKSRDCWLLVSTGPPHTPAVLLLDKVGEGRFCRMGYVPMYTHLSEERFKHFRATEFILV